MITLEALSDIDPGLKLDPDIFTLGNTVYFDPAKKTVGSGKLMSMPISPLIPVLYYRGDLYKEAGLAAPQTFADLEANARKFNKPPRQYGIVQRGARADMAQPGQGIQHLPHQRERPGHRRTRRYDGRHRRSPGSGLWRRRRWWQR